MALIQYSALVNGMSGKLNGSVMASNKGGSYVRNKGVVTNPNTNYQLNVRSSFGSISGAWRGLSDNQRNSWITFAKNVPYTNPFGESKYLSGFGMFQQRNLNLSVLGLPLILSAPIDQAFPNITMGVITFSAASAVVVNYSATGITNWRPVVDATRLLSNGITNVYSELRILNANPTITGTAPVQIATITNYPVRFGNTQPLAKIGVGLYFINIVTGQSTVEYVTTVNRAV